MKKIIVACIVSMAIFSCCTGSSSKVDRDKTYLYVEVSGNNASGVYRTKIDTIEIIEKNDSLAYLKAFEKSCVSQWASVITAEEMRKHMGSRYEERDEYHDFRLLDENFEEVNHTVVPDSVLAEIAKSIFSIKLE